MATASTHDRIRAARMLREQEADLDGAEVLILHALLSSCWVDPADLLRARTLFERLALPPAPG